VLYPIGFGGLWLKPPSQVKLKVKSCKPVLDCHIGCSKLVEFNRVDCYWLLWTMWRMNHNLEKVPKDELSKVDSTIHKGSSSTSNY
jgi:hypothetical protein